MSRPTTKTQLIEAATVEFARLWEIVESVPAALRDTEGCCGQWSVKDVLAHLEAWHQMALGWERAGSAGVKPPMPAEGYTWSQIPDLNAEIWAEHRDDRWGDVVRRLKRSHGRVLEVIERYDDEDLFTKRRFAWTGTTSVGSYLVSATSSHYAWARQLIRAWVTSQAQ